jgi:hypothetical protein
MASEVSKSHKQRDYNETHDPNDGGTAVAIDNKGERISENIMDGPLPCYN